MANPISPSPARKVAPRSWAVATLAALSVAAPVAPALLVAAPALASETSENGEAGESAVAHQDGVAGFLTDLGLFEAAHRIVGALYERGDYALALEHLEASHHAHYDDLATGIETYGAPGFADETAAFAEAVRTQAATETTAARLAVLLAAIDTARAASEATAGQRILAMKTLLDVAAADYAAGVENSLVVFDIEYRDSWGFVDTVRARAQALTTDADPAVAAAGAEILAQLAPLAPLFPGVEATETTGDPAAIAVAAAWVEIIALRLR